MANVQSNFFCLISKLLFLFDGTSEWNKKEETKKKVRRLTDLYATNDKLHGNSESTKTLWFKMMQIIAYISIERMAAEKKLQIECVADKLWLWQILWCSALLLLQTNVMQVQNDGCKKLSVCNVEIVVYFYVTFAARVHDPCQ